MLARGKGVHNVNDAEKRSGGCVNSGRVYAGELADRVGRLGVNANVWRRDIVGFGRMREEVIQQLAMDRSYNQQYTRHPSSRDNSRICVYLAHKIFRMLGTQTGQQPSPKISLCFL